MERDAKEFENFSRQVVVVVVVPVQVFQTEKPGIFPKLATILPKRKGEKRW